MPEGVCVRVRRLPGGEYCEAKQISINGRFLELEVAGAVLPLGSLLEIEQTSALYWGELQQLAGSKALVFVEHCLDKSRLEPIREIWGE
jgi:hypothetical protein